MNRHLKRSDMVEERILAAMDLGTDLELLQQRLSTDHAIPVDELRQEAIRIAMLTRGMTDDERLAHVAGELSCSPVALRAEAQLAREETGA